MDADDQFVRYAHLAVADRFGPLAGSMDLASCVEVTLAPMLDAVLQSMLPTRPRR